MNSGLNENVRNIITKLENLTFEELGMLELYEELVDNVRVYTIELISDAVVHKQIEKGGRII